MSTVRTQAPASAYTVNHLQCRLYSPIISRTTQNHDLHYASSHRTCLRWIPEVGDAASQRGRPQRSTREKKFVKSRTFTSGQRACLCFGLDTQKEQDAEDEKARKQAMQNLVSSWQERLQLISVIVSPRTVLFCVV